MERRAKKLSPEEAKLKIYRYCAYQERSHQDVKKKLYELGLYSAEVEELISHLITENYLNEERFAKAYAGGKFRIKQWGRNKIINELEAKSLTQTCIKAGLKEIDEGDYQNTIQRLLLKKAAQLSELSSVVRRDRLAKYLIQKGYESDLVWRFIKESQI